MKTSKPKAARDRLFRHGRPNIRPLDINDNGLVGKDMAILWAAREAFTLEESDQEEFTRVFLDYLGQFYAVWIVDDKNYHYPDGFGATGLIVSTFNGWSLTPKFIAFPWATDKNRLKAVVAFMQMARYEKGIGMLNLSTTAPGFFQHIRKRYGVMYYVGKVPRGERGTDAYLFYGRGKDFYTCHSS